MWKFLFLREAWQNDAHFYFTALINSKRRKMQLIMHKGYCVQLCSETDDFSVFQLHGLFLIKTDK